MTRKAPAKPRRRSADYTREEIAWLTAPSEPIESLLGRPEPPPMAPVEVPPWVYEPPGWLRGEGLGHLIARPGSGDPGPPPRSTR
jgi:hypothetical protein